MKRTSSCSLSCGCVQHFSYACTVLDLRCISASESSWLVRLYACLPLQLFVCISNRLDGERRCRRSHWLLKVALLHQARPFNQVPHIRQLCPHSKQPLCLIGELQHPAGGERGQLALGDQPKLPLPRDRERLHLCVCLRNKQGLRDYKRHRGSAAEKGIKQKSLGGSVSMRVCIFAQKNI